MVDLFVVANFEEIREKNKEKVCVQLIKRKREVFDLISCKGFAVMENLWRLMWWLMVMGYEGKMFENDFE